MSIVLLLFLTLQHIQSTTHTCSELPAVLVTTSNDEVVQITEESTPEVMSRSINIFLVILKLSIENNGDKKIHKINNRN